MYYLYKITLTDHPHYYIGVTNNYRGRRRSHQAAIRQVLKNKLDNRCPVPKNASFVHYKIVELIFKKVSKSKNPLSVLHWHFRISMISVNKNGAVIASLEHERISSIDEFCLNTQKESRYTNYDIPQKLKK